MSEFRTIIISRTDSIGDVVLTLPLAHVLKKKIPGCKIIFLGKKYTKPVLECCRNIDEILCWDEMENFLPGKQTESFTSLKADCLIHVFPNRKVASLAKKAGIPLRIGTSHRLFHWLTCNKLPNFTRKNSELHEAQLNFKLLEPLGISTIPEIDEMKDQFDLGNTQPLSSDLLSLIDKGKINLILHPGSRGSAVDWNLRNFSELIRILPSDKFKIFLTGTENEHAQIQSLLLKDSAATDLSGKLSLAELISFIRHCDALVAASTGPLHLAAVLGKLAIGLYPSVRPLHPGRWAPIGKKVKVLVAQKHCSNCGKGTFCDCLSSIQPQEVADVLSGI